VVVRRYYIFTMTDTKLTLPCIRWPLLAEDHRLWDVKCNPLSSILYIPLCTDPHIHISSTFCSLVCLPLPPGPPNMWSEPSGARVGLLPSPQDPPHTAWDIAQKPARTPKTHGKSCKSIKMAPQDGPKMAKDAPKMAPTQPKMAHGPKTAQHGPRRAQDSPNTTQDGNNV
jgi:hypothetical protein